MGLRFRRSWSLVPGIRLNLGLKSGSVSFGTRGLHYTVGTSGSRITAGLPGTGLFWTEKLRSPSVAVPPQQRTQNQLTSAATAQPAQAQQPRTVTPLTGAGAQFPAPQPQSFSPIIGARQPPQLRQPRQGTAGQYTATQKAHATKRLFSFANSLSPPGHPSVASLGYRGSNRDRRSVFPVGYGQ